MEAESWAEGLDGRFERSLRTYEVKNISGANWFSEDDFKNLLEELNQTSIKPNNLVTTNWTPDKAAV